MMMIVKFPLSFFLIKKSSRHTGYVGCPVSVNTVVYMTGNIDRMVQSQTHNLFMTIFFHSLVAASIDPDESVSSSSVCTGIWYLSLSGWLDKIAIDEYSLSISQYAKGHHEQQQQ